MIDEMLDHSSEKLARRSLLISALLTIFFTNLTLTDPSLNVLGMELLLSQANIIAFGKLATLILSFVFLALILPKFVSQIIDIRIHMVSKKKTEEIYHLKVDNGYFDPGPPQSVSELIKDEENGLAHATNNLLSHRETITRWLKFLTHLLVDLGLPIVIATIAIYWPNWVVTVF